MDFIDEQHIARFQMGEQRRQIARPFQHGTRGLAQPGAHLVGDDVRQRRLAEPRRTEQQDVIQRLAASASRSDEDLHLAVHGGLTDVIGQLTRAQGAVDRLLAALRRGCHQPIALNGHGGSLERRAQREADQVSLSVMAGSSDCRRSRASLAR